MKYSQDTRSSFGASFRSDKDSISRAGADASEPMRTKNVSLKRLYSLAGPDWIYGIVGTIGAFVSGSLMPLFALGVTQALVAFYMDWDMTRHEVKKIVILFCCGAVISVIFYGIEHLSFGIMGERLTLRVREMMFTGKYLALLLPVGLPNALPIAFISSHRESCVFIRVFYHNFLFLYKYLESSCSIECIKNSLSVRERAVSI